MSGLRVLVVGRPGSGKGTQCERLAAVLGLPHVSAGDLLRAAAAADGPPGDEVRRLLAAGRLVPDATVGPLVRERLRRADARERGFLLDGYPRTCGQLHAVRQWLAPESVGVVVELVVSEETALRRLAGRGRPDDTEAAVRRRLAEFDLETAPMLAELRAGEYVISVDADRRVSEVTAELFDRLARPQWGPRPAAAGRRPDIRPVGRPVTRQDRAPAAGV